ncbi:MAG: Sir2 silent information regulator family NAD-dependent deacetylase [Lachnospiraceae bacterium]|nr:Sir2 silent information regulator family NAD-dependent deacetylase [Lachnospiraceae bacterium]
MIKKVVLPKGRVDFTQFLSGMPARDYVFQNEPYDEQIKEAAGFIRDADAIIIGAGAGLSTAAGLNYGGKRFTDNFAEFIEKYGSEYMRDMYSSGFYPFPTEEAKWGYWSKHAYVNRIEPEAFPLYEALYKLVKDKPHFVLTTNVDHQFWKAGFADEDIFATQGDYGEIQCEKGCHDKVYDAIDIFKQMNQARKDCLIPSYMVPKCPVCGGSMAMHLRSDRYFVEEEHWHEAARHYAAFLKEHKNDNVVLLELGVGFNTPIIIRFPFEKMMREHENWVMVRMNLEEAVVPESLGKRAVGINEDIAKSIEDIAKSINDGKRVDE